MKWRDQNSWPLQDEGAVRANDIECRRVDRGQQKAHQGMNDVGGQWLSDVVAQDSMNTRFGCERILVSMCANHPPAVGDVIARFICLLYGQPLLSGF